MSTIAIIGAMDEEVANIASALSDITVTEEAGVSVTRGAIETNKGTRVNVAATVGGMGTVNIAATTQHLIDADQPDAVIFSGIAGNLNTHLHINDVVLGGTLRYLDTDMRLADQPVEEFHSDGRLIEVADKVLTDLNVHHITGIIATGNYFVDDPKKVELVIRETGADAVEMEGAAVAHVAARNDLPVLVIRALSDNADTDYVEFKEFDISEYADTAAKIAVNIVKRM